jgi:hypothetical protein
MIILYTALRGILLSSSVVDAVAAGGGTIASGNNTSFAITSSIAMTAAVTTAFPGTVDVQVSAEDVRKGFVSDASMRTHHETIILFFY